MLTAGHSCCFREKAFLRQKETFSGERQSNRTPTLLSTERCTDEATVGNATAKYLRPENFIRTCEWWVWFVKCTRRMWCSNISRPSVNWSRTNSPQV